VVHKGDIRHPNENVMSYGAADSATSSSTPAPYNLDSGDESDLTPLPSEDEDEHGNPKLDANKLKVSVPALRQRMSTVPTLQFVVPQPVVRPGVQEEGDVDTDLNSFERTGVTHLVHASVAATKANSQLVVLA